ncbi:MAG TPA: pyruvate dehydrogenase (acetyl-transferring) E1 component subunit alpha [Chloroflexota bacterium]|nr:pyruvate dehydrogenase (acetyl-transferring) E1 component subunit alpha [Chloroflexota bacterium]
MAIDTKQQDSALAQHSREELLGIHHLMLLNRRFEEKVGEMYTRAKVGGFLHLNIGEEATFVGAIRALQTGDYVYSTYREHGHAISHGVDPKRVMAELFGRVDGTSRGRGGSMHLFDSEKRFMGGYAIVAGSIALAVGTALAIQYRAGSEIVLSMFGDGATNNGTFHESLNLAKVWRLPVLFLCGNNQYGMGSAVDRVSAVHDMYVKAQAYNIPAERVDGMDVIAVLDAARRAVQHIRDEQTPYFLEAVTYRYRGHSMADPQVYRSKEEVEEWRKRDAIESFRHRLREAGLAGDEDFDAHEKDVERIVQEAVDFADASPEPEPEQDLLQNVYVGDLPVTWR